MKISRVYKCEIFTTECCFYGNYSVAILQMIHKSTIIQHPPPSNCLHEDSLAIADALNEDNLAEDNASRESYLLHLKFDILFLDEII